MLWTMGSESQTVHRRFKGLKRICGERNSLAMSIPQRVPKWKLLSVDLRLLFEESVTPGSEAGAILVKVIGSSDHH